MDKHFKIALLICIIFTLLTFSIYTPYVKANMLGGTIVDETKTPWGDKFLNAFKDYWSPPGVLDQYYVEIVGQPTRSGTSEKVVVKAGTIFHKRAVYAQIISPRSQKLKSQAQEAVNRTIKYLVRRYIEENVQTQSATGD